MKIGSELQCTDATGGQRRSNDPVVTQVLTTRDYAPTLVTWRLESTAAGGTRVSVTHSGWAEDVKGVDSVDSTWAWILRELKNVLETGAVARSTAAKYALIRGFLWALPARTRSDRVQVPAWLPETAPGADDQTPPKDGVEDG